MANIKHSELTTGIPTKDSFVPAVIGGQNRKVQLNNLINRLRGITVGRPIVLFCLAQSNGTAIDSTVPVQDMPINPRVKYFQGPTVTGPAGFTLQVADPNRVTGYTDPDIITGMRGSVAAPIQGPANSPCGSVSWSCANYIQQAIGGDQEVWVVETTKPGAPISQFEVGVGAVAIQFVDCVNAFLALPEVQAAGITGPDGMIWLQGDSNVLDSPQSYTDAFKQIKSDLEALFITQGQCLWMVGGFVDDAPYVNSPNLDYVLGQTGTDVVYVSPAGCDPIGDGAHYKGVGYNKFGERYGETFLIGATISPRRGDIPVADIDYASGTAESDIPDYAFAVTGFNHRVINTLTAAGSKIAQWIMGAINVGWDKDGFPFDTSMEQGTGGLADRLNFLKDVSFKGVNFSINTTTAALEFIGYAFGNQVVSLFKQTAFFNSEPGKVIYGAPSADPAATTNTKGADVDISPGDGATSGTGGNGGNINLLPGSGGGSGGSDGFTLLNGVPYGLAVIANSTVEPISDGTLRNFTACWSTGAALNKANGVSFNTSTGEFTIEVPGIYLCCLTMTLQSPVPESIDVGLALNGTGLLINTKYDLDTGIDNSGAIIAPVLAAQGDVISVTHTCPITTPAAITARVGQFVVMRLS